MKLVNEKIKSYNYALELDIKDFFPTINHSILLDKIQPNLREIIRSVIKAKYLDKNKIKVLNKAYL